MTPKEKAKELRDNMWDAMDMRASLQTTRKAVLFLIDEILEIKSVDRDYELSNYWQEVKQELEKL